MKDFVKEFTVIDILGILPSGVLLILLLSCDWSTYPLWQGYFGETCSEVTKITILLVAGYFAGMLLHELGDWMEKLVFCIRWLDPRWWAANKVGLTKLVNKLVRDGVAEEKKKPDSKGYGQLKTGTAHILAALAKDGANEKQGLFDGFHAAMRNFLVAVLILGVYMLFTGFGTPLSDIVRAALGMRCWQVVGASAILLSAVRGYHYLYLKYKYAFENYLLLKD